LRFFKGNSSPDNKFTPQLHVNAFYDLILAKKSRKNARSHCVSMRAKCKFVANNEYVIPLANAT
jgi:hypothetical protein